MHYLDAEYRRSLQAYVVDYLKEEVFDEGLTRNVAAFSRFFDAVGYSLGDLTNYANIARDCGVDAKTVKEYYQILVDTLLGTFIEPWTKRQERQVIGKAAKFYLFDVGVAGAITRRHIAEERGEQFGRALEHFVLMEIVAHRSYRDLGYGVHFWRTKSGRAAGPDGDNHYSAESGGAFDGEIESYAKGIGENLNFDRFYFLGSATRYGLSCEVNLKMKEMTLTHSEPFHFLEFRHGPMSMVNQNAVVVGMLTDGNRVHEAKVLSEMEALGGTVASLGESEADVQFES